jgi:hypothetical protein
VIAWHRRGFARFWAWKSRRVGRPPLAPEIVALIAQMACDNPLWSRRRIANELAKLGYAVGKDAGAKYMPRPARRPPRPPSTTWATFVRAHLAETLAIDFLTVPTATFGVLYVFFVLSLERRRVLHVNVTAHRHATWAGQQVVEALGPEEPAMRRLIRDRDGIYGKAFNTRERAPRARALRHRAAVTVAKRIRGAIRGHAASRVARPRRRSWRATLAPFGSPARRILHRDRPHMSLAGDAPVHRPIEPPGRGRVVARSRVSGLHHRYVRIAA